MPGDGACDLTGVIPYTAIPQVYDPPAHVVATDNQRPVSASYPYYVGTSDDFYDPGYRAAHAYSSLESSLASGSVSAGTIAALQNNQTDSLAAQIVPQLLTALKSGALTPMEKSAASLLASWDDSMSENSAAATVWWQFWSDYLAVVFDPWWKADHVPVQQDRSGLLGGANLVPLVEDLQAWTLAAGTATSPVPPAQAALVATADAAFRGPSGKARGCFGRDARGVQQGRHAVVGAARRHAVDLDVGAGARAGVPVAGGRGRAGIRAASGGR